MPYILFMHKDIAALIEGYQKFYQNHFMSEESSFRDLVRLGQQPKALVIACSDSRVDPALVMNCQPGDLFVIRNVANLVPPYEEDDQSYHGTSAALEFGVCVLEIKHIILFGHTQCGGIQSLLEHSHEKCGPKSFLTKWMEMAKEAHDVTLTHHDQMPNDIKISLCGQYSLIHSLKNLETFPWIAEKIHHKKLELHAWNFRMAEGVLEGYDKKLCTFNPLSMTFEQEKNVI